MHVTHKLASVAALIGDPTRAGILVELLDGCARTATELSQLTALAPSTTSGHLLKLVDGELIVVEKQGRHRYYRLKDHTVAEALESLMTVTAGRPSNKIQFGPKDQAMRAARMCYDHLAGSLGIRIIRSMTDRGLVIVEADNLSLTTAGERHLEELGIDIDTVRQQRRAFARLCLDWSERQFHLAGGLGAALAARLFALKWIKRSRTSRTVLLTEVGRRGLRQYFPVGS